MSPHLMIIVREPVIEAHNTDLTGAPYAASRKSAAAARRLLGAFDDVDCRSDADVCWHRPLQQAAAIRRAALF